MTRTKSSLSYYIMIGLMLIFFYGPIVMLIVFSFNASRSLTVWSGFSTQWYSQLFRDRDTMQAVQNSVTVGVIATFVSTIVGTLSAIALTKQRQIFKRIFMSLNNLPVLNPEIVTAVSLMLLFSSMSFIQKGYMTMLLAHITFCIPYVILTVLPKLRSLDDSLADAAMDLGATPTQALRKVILPQLVPAIISAALLAFTMSFDDFVISYFVSGEVSNISIRVFTMSKRINPTINALSTIIIVIITIALILINVIPLIRDRKKGSLI